MEIEKLETKIYKLINLPEQTHVTKTLLHGNKDTKYLRQYQSILHHISENANDFESKDTISEFYWCNKNNDTDFETTIETKYQKYNKKLNLQQLLSLSEETNKKLSESTLFETKSPKEIIEILQNRVNGLQTCKESKSDNTYFEKEHIRENIILKDTTLNDNDKIVKFANNINLGSKNLFAKYDSETITNIIKLLNNNNNLIKKLFTYFPETCFNININNKEIKINEDVLTQFLNEIGSIRDNETVQQFILGFGEDLTKQPEFQYPQLAIMYPFEHDIYTRCHELAEWSPYLNLLTIYLFTKSNNKKFPLRLILPETLDNTHMIRKHVTYDIDFVLEHTEFIGNYFLKYQYSNIESRIWTILFFKVKPNHESKISLSNHTGIVGNYLALTLKGTIADNDSITDKVSITHHEIHHLYYFQEKKLLKGYVLNNKMNEIFFANHNTISNIIHLLGMEEVKLIKTKNHKHQPDLFTVKKVKDVQNLGFLHSGGGNQPNLTTTKSFNKVLSLEKELAGKFYHNYMKFQEQLSSGKVGDGVFYNTFTKNFYIYPYIFSGEQFSSFNLHLKDKIKMEIVKYRPIAHSFYRYYEIFKLFIDKLSTNDSVLVVDSAYYIIELLWFMRYKVKKIDFVELPKSTVIQQFKIHDTLEKNIKQICRDFNLVSNNKTIYDILDNDKLDTYDLNIYGQRVYIWDKISYIEHHYNSFNMYVALIHGLTRTKKGGMFILNVESITAKTNADVYLILKKYFQESHIYYPDICNLFKRNGTYLIFKKFLGISKTELKPYLDILKKVRQLYPNGVKDFNIKEEKLRKQFEVSLPNPNKSITYLAGFLDTSKEDYQEIIEFNNDRYMKQYRYCQKLVKLIDSNIDVNRIHLPTKEQITQTIMYCKKWDIEYFPYFDSAPMKDVFGKQILSEIYGLLEPLEYQFKTPYQNYVVTKMSLGKMKSLKKSKQVSSTFKINTTGKSKSKSKLISRNSLKTKKSKIKSFDINFNVNNFLKDFELSKKDNINQSDYRGRVGILDDIYPINNSISQTEKMIDSRRDFTKEGPMQLATYFETNYLFRYYKHSGRGQKHDLTVDAKKLSGNNNISQAWLKMFEILSNTKLIRKKKGVFKSFHLCEAPGSFIDCINYFLKLKTNVTEFEWNAQSLKPKGKSIIGDQLGLLKKYKNRWHWGADGTGNITNVENIKYYKQFCNDIELITSDCGLKMGTPGYEHVVYSSMVSILYLLPPGKNMMFKIVSPIDTPIIWNMIYLYYQNFKKFSFYKPVQNNQSREFYIVGIDYLGTDTKILKTLMYYVKHFDEEIDLFDDNYPEPFVRQAIQASQLLADNWIQTIHKQLYYNDNFDKLDKSFIKMTGQYLDEKNQDWIKKYKLKPLAKRDYL